MKNNKCILIICFFILLFIFSSCIQSKPIPIKRDIIEVKHPAGGKVALDKSEIISIILGGDQCIIYFKSSPHYLKVDSCIPLYKQFYN